MIFARDAGAIHQAVQQGDSVSADQFKAGVAELRTEIAGLDKRLSAEIAGVRTDVADLDKRLATQIATVETRLLHWMVGAVFAAAWSLAGFLPRCALPSKWSHSP